MKFGSDWIMIAGTLENKDEATAYIKFLISEYHRHEKDIDDIARIIYMIREIWGISSSDIKLEKVDK